MSAAERQQQAQRNAAERQAAAERLMQNGRFLSAGAVIALRNMQDAAAAVFTYLDPFFPSCLPVGWQERDQVRAVRCNARNAAHGARALRLLDLAIAAKGAA